MCARAWYLFAANVPAHIRTHTRTRVVLDAATNTHKKHKFVKLQQKDKNQKHTQKQILLPFVSLLHKVKQYKSLIFSMFVPKNEKK